MKASPDEMWNVFLPPNIMAEKHDTRDLQPCVCVCVCVCVSIDYAHRPSFSLTYAVVSNAWSGPLW